MEISMIFMCFIALSVVFLLTLLVFTLYSGLFFIITPGAGPPPIKNVTIAYKFARGPYKNCHTFFTEVTSLAPKLRCVGIYYDDPQTVPSERLRWAVGTILAEGTTPADPEQLRLMSSKGYRLATLPAVSNAVKCTFPYNTFLSVIIAIFRVYPLVGEYVRINKLCAHPYLEIYDGHTIHFMAPLAKQDEFYVPEASLEAGEELECEDHLVGLDADHQRELEEVKPSTSGQADQAQKSQDKKDKKKAEKGKDKKEKKKDEEEKKGKESDKVDTEKNEKERELSSKPKVTDSSGKRSPSEEAASSETQQQETNGNIQDSGVSSTAAGAALLSTASDASLSPSPEPASPGSPLSLTTSASDGSITMSETSALTNTTDASSILSTDGEGMSCASTEQSGVLSGFSSESDTEPFEVVRKEDVK